MDCRLWIVEDGEPDPQSTIGNPQSIHEAALAALYLRGVDRPANPPRRGWPEVLAALRRRSGEDPARVLREAGMSLPATILQTAGLLAWAEEAVENGGVLTAASEGYPLRWFQAFGDLAPPALWRDGPLPTVPWVGAVGSRRVGADALEFMDEVGARTAALGHGLVSGGAKGCDSAAEAAALREGGAVLRLLPHGLGTGANEDDATRLAVAAPVEPFSAGLAMERNALIYGAAEATVVGHARMRQGGTWHGATEALRRRYGPLLVREDGSSAARALCALGAEPFPDPAELGERLAAGPPQRSLFAYETRRRRAYRDTRSP